MSLFLMSRNRRQTARYSGIVCSGKWLHSHVQNRTKGPACSSLQAGKVLRETIEALCPASVERGNSLNMFRSLEHHNLLSMRCI